MSYLGHKIVNTLLEAETVQELDDAVQAVNQSYGPIREQLEVIELLMKGRN